MNTFKKLSDGSWGVSTSDPSVQPGATIVVQTRTGATRNVTLADQYGRETFRGVAYRIFRVAQRPQEARAVEQVGDLSGIMQMFNRAAGHLRRPAIVLSVGGLTLRLSVAGARARFPGTINVTSQDQRDADNRRAWYGRINRAGGFEPGRDAPEGLGAGLRRFAADPASVAAEHGRLTGRCCFCNHALGEGEDRRSVEVGYGPVCADHFGLPWGARAAAPAPVAREDYAMAPVARAGIVAAAVIEAYARAVEEGRLLADPNCTVSQMQSRLDAIAN